MVEVQQWLDFILVIAAVIGVVYSLFRWSNRKLVDTIREVTAQIQPGANGGNSLADVNKSVRQMSESLDRSTQRIHKRIDELSGDVRDLQLWAADRPCLLDRHDRVARAKAKLKQDDECGDDNA